MAEIAKIKINPDAKVDRMLTVPEGTVSYSSGKLYWAGPAIRNDEGSVSIEHFAAGSTVNWAFGYSEFHYILDGKAEMTYKLGPLYVEEKTVTVEKGDIYLIPKGAVIRWKIDPSGPLKKVCIIMPGARVDLWFKDIPEDVLKKLYKTGINGKYG